MKLATCSLVLMASTIAIAKNSLPRNDLQDLSLRHPVDGDVPSVRHRAAEVSKDHVFHGNYKTNFSWNNDQLQDRLWAGKDKRKRVVTKRAPAGAIVLGTVIKLPSCAGCIKQAITGEQANLNTLTPDYLKTVMLLNQGQLLDRCVFYTSVEDQSDASARWFLGGADTHPSLSKVATDWANANNLITIWNLYSGANDVTGAEDNPQDYNYWEVYTPGSWLNNLKDDQGTQFRYFGAMSNAMAQQCGGTVYVMSCTPKNLQKFGRIWANDEWPAIRNNYLAGTVYQPFELIALDCTAPDLFAYEIDIETLAVIDGPRTRRSLELEKVTVRNDTISEDLRSLAASVLAKRDLNDANVAYEPSNEDWFGYGGAFNICHWEMHMVAAANLPLVSEILEIPTT